MLQAYQGPYMMEAQTLLFPLFHKKSVIAAVTQHKHKRRLKHLSPMNLVKPPFTIKCTLVD